jgi:hypothetical protein
MSHTPGPWAVQPVKGSFQVPFHIVSEDGKPVAYCEGQQLRPDRTSVGEARANARLIAAAPEMLAALRTAVRVMQDNNLDEALAGEFDIFTDAIAKAEGRE